MNALIKIPVQSHFSPPYEIMYDGGWSPLMGCDKRFLTGSIFNPDNEPDYVALVPCIHEGPNVVRVQSFTDSEITIEVD